MVYRRISEDLKNRVLFLLDSGDLPDEQWIQNLRIGKVSERLGYKSAETRVSKVGCREKEAVERMIGWHWQVGVLSKF